MIPTRAGSSERVVIIALIITPRRRLAFGLGIREPIGFVNFREYIIDDLRIPFFLGVSSGLLT